MNFGDRILVKAFLTRKKYNHLEDPQNPKKYARYWHRTEHEKPVEAIFLGKRNLYNGNPEYDEKGDNWFEGLEVIKGAWVCRKGRNPEKVFLYDCEPAPADPKLMQLFDELAHMIRTI